MNVINTWRHVTIQCMPHLTFQFPCIQNKIHMKRHFTADNLRQANKPTKIQKACWYTSDEQKEYCHTISKKCLTTWLISTKPKKMNRECVIIYCLCVCLSVCVFFVCVIVIAEIWQFIDTARTVVSFWSLYILL